MKGSSRGMSVIVISTDRHLQGGLGGVMMECEPFVFCMVDFLSKVVCPSFPGVAGRSDGG